MLSALGNDELGSRFGPASRVGRFTGPTYQSSFNPDSRTWRVGLRAYFLNPISCPPQPLVTASVGKDYIVSWIGCDFHVIAQGWFD